MFPSKTKFELHKRKFHLQKCEFCNCKIKIGRTEWETQQNMQNHYNSKHRESQWFWIKLRSFITFIENKCSKSWCYKDFVVYFVLKSIILVFSDFSSWEKILQKPMMLIFMVFDFNFNSKPIFSGYQLFVGFNFGSIWTRTFNLF